MSFSLYATMFSIVLHKVHIFLEKRAECAVFLKR